MTEHRTLEIERDQAPRAELTEDIRGLVETVKEKRILERCYEENPYAVLAAAAGVGYLLGGGAFSPFSRRIARIGMKAMLLPMAASQLKHLNQDS